MNRFIFLVIFFYTCTFTQPPQVKAAIPLGIIGAAAIGLSLGVAGSSTNYNINTNGDWTFSTSKLTTPIVIYNELLIGGAKVALGYVKNVDFDLSSAYNNNLFKDFPSISEIIDNYFGPENSFKTPSTTSVAQFDSNNYIFKYYIQEGYPLQHLAIILPAIEWVRQGNGSYWLYQNQKTQTYVSNGTTYYVYKRFISLWFPTGSPANYDPNPVARPTTLPDSDKGPLAAQIASQAASNPAVKNALNNVAAANPSLVDKPPALTVEDLKAYSQQAAINAQQQLVDQLNSLSSANPTNASIAAELAKAQAELAKIQAEQVNEQTDDPPEPNYPVPSVWYTGKCDKNNVSSCFNYQQILDATDAFKTTALYQAPHLLLDCLGYVKGDGCEYPPRISINLFSRYSSEQTNIDLTPFQSAVNVMKFFFSLLCFICTYKAVMTLFR